MVASLWSTKHFGNTNQPDIKGNELFHNAWFGYWFILKKMSLKEPIADNKWYSGICWYCQMTLQTDPFVSDTSKVQMKVNWTVGERLLPCDQLVVCKCRLTLFKAQWAFLQRLVLNFIAFEKRAFEKGLCWCHATRRELIRISDGLANENQFYNAG